MVRLIAIFIVGCFACAQLNGQIILSGKTFNQHNEPLQGVNITLNIKGQQTIIAFAITDKSGSFSISLQEPPTALLELTAARLGYKTQVIGFTVGIQSNFSITLSSETIVLPEVKVKALPVWKRRDTINYSVPEFMQKQDRVIGDIIARLPGMEVTPEGQIKYNGKAINKYYIEGLDLLEEKYGLANNNIPASSVETVQVLENHQPIRILDSVTFSDRAALNIKLKSNAKAKIIGTAKLGAGGAPFLGEAEAVPMMFKKNFQFIQSYKFNNTGVNVVKELAPKNLVSSYNLLEGGLARNDLLMINLAPRPQISAPRFLFNNTHAASVNFLLPLKKPGWQYRINTSFVQDVNRQENGLTTQIARVSDTITIMEKDETKSVLGKVQGDFTLIANTQKFYLRNNTQVQGWWSHGSGTVTNNIILNQFLKTPFYLLSNEFNLLKIKAGRIIEYASNTGYSYSPQQLVVNPGIYQDLFNNNIPYDELKQKASLRTFYTDNYFSIRKKRNSVTTSLKIGASLNRQYFNSELFVITDGEEKTTPDSFYNRLSGLRIKPYAEVGLSYQKDKWKISITVPVRYNHIRFDDTIQEIDLTYDKLVFSPVTNVIVDFSSTWSLSLTASLQPSFGDINSITEGYILKTYRSINRNNSALTQTYTTTLSGTITYRDPLHMIFWTNGLFYSGNNTNLMYRQVFTGYLETLEALRISNENYSSSVFGNMNKYLPKLKTSLTLLYSYGSQNALQIQNDDLVKFTNRVLNVGVNVSSKIKSLATLEYSGNLKRYSSFSQLSPGPAKIRLFNQSLSLNYFLAKYWIFQFKGEHFQTYNRVFKASDYYFADFSVRFRKQKKLEYEAGVQNIFNTRSFTTLYLSNNEQTVTFFKLRPRQVIARVYLAF